MTGLTLHTWGCIECDANYGGTWSDDRKAVRSSAMRHSDEAHHRVRVTTERRSHETIIPAAAAK